MPHAFPDAIITIALASCVVVARRTLDPFAQVRILARQPLKNPQISVREKMLISCPPRTSDNISLYVENKSLTSNLIRGAANEGKARSF